MSLEENLDKDLNAGEEPEPRNWEVFLRDQEKLLKYYHGKVVAYGGGKFLDYARSVEELIERIRIAREIKGKAIIPLSLFIERVTEEVFKEKLLEADMPGIYEVEFPNEKGKDEKHSG